MKKRAIPFRDYLLLTNISPVIKYLTISDVILFSGSGLFSPIFAIFVVDNISGANVAVVGVATTIFWVTKSVVQVPVANLVDRIRGDRDDFWFMFIGTICSALVPLAYLLVSTVPQLYFVQFLHGAITATTFPSFMALYTRHIDKDREGTEWGVYHTLTDFSWALTAAIGGFVALVIGFPALIWSVSVISLFGALLLYPLRRVLCQKTKKPN
ncbi:MFS transporter [Patescibacteria group bacterium]|nr:MFS transporter [Patescibacteria group bacterium]MBU1705920.1 MFS transporter [Patescibacteria group bacterium]